MGPRPSILYRRAGGRQRTRTRCSSPGLASGPGHRTDQGGGKRRDCTRPACGSSPASLDAPPLETGSSEAGAIELQPCRQLREQVEED
jgi:hypothetical protein